MPSRPRPPTPVHWHLPGDLPNEGDAGAAKKVAEDKLEERRKKEEARGKKFGGRPSQIPNPEQARPEAQAQRNFTDPESRIMPDGAHKGAFMQAYRPQTV